MFDVSNMNNKVLAIVKFDLIINYYIYKHLFVGLLTEK